jgi:3-isopropylmalate/(R)-2-methylmalate dehydratase small subunit
MSGRVFLLGDNVSTDAIMPGRYNVTTDPDALRRACLIEARPDFVAEVQPGDVIVAGRNFGCGSSREHAPLSIKQNGVAAVIAAGFSRIFYRNAVNIGLPVIRCVDAHRVLRERDVVSIDTLSGEIVGPHGVLQGEPPSGVALRIIESGSLLELIGNGGWAAFEEKRHVS